jgi:hypothetical protein
VLGRLSETAREAVARGATSVRRAPVSVAVRRTASARGARETLRDIGRSFGLRRLAWTAAIEEARRALTLRPLAWSTAFVLAFALPFAAGATRSSPTPARPLVIEPPARAAAPTAPQLSRVAALPQPPRVVRRRRPPTPVVTAPAPVATPAPVETPAAVAPTPAPTPAPAPVPAPEPEPEPKRETFDLEG